MEIRFDVYFKKHLGTLFKSNEIDPDGKQAHVNLKLDLVDRLEVNHFTNGAKYTDDVCIADIDKNLIQIPFNEDIVKAGKNEFEIVAYMKDGEKKVSQTYIYSIERAVGEDPCINSSDNNNNGGNSGGSGNSDGHTHTNLTTLNSITQSKVNKWDNKADSKFKRLGKFFLSFIFYI